MGKYQIKSHSKVSNLLHWDSNIQAKSQVLNRISHQNLESSKSKSKIESQNPKQQTTCSNINRSSQWQKRFSEHISILLVPANGNHWNFHFRCPFFGHCVSECCIILLSWNRKREISHFLFYFTRRQLRRKHKICRVIAATDPQPQTKPSG